MCGVSAFVEGRRPTVTVVVTELPDNPGAPVAKFFADAARRIRKGILKGVSASSIAWLCRRPASENARESMFAVDLDEDKGTVRAMNQVDPSRLGSIVNRGGGFVRRGVFIPAFRPLAEAGARRRLKEPDRHVLL
jgi:hypothetical protein